jgi:alginate O-acetyltransferase complex protein AlgI
VWDRWLPRIGLALLTYALVNLTWVFFRAQDFDTAWRIITAMLLLDTGGKPLLDTWPVYATAATIGLMLAVHWTLRSRELHAEVQRLPGWLVGLAWGGMLFLIAITQSDSDAFIYFQF